MDFDTSIIAPPPVALPASEPMAAARPARRVPHTTILARAHFETARTEARENLVWLALSLSALLLLVLSFWT